MQRARGHLLVVVAGAALVASSFVPLWATYRVPGLGLVAPQTSHQNAWAAYGLTMQLALAGALAATCLSVLALVRPAISLPHRDVVVLALCAASTTLLLWQVVRGPQGSASPGGYGIERGLLLFTGAALAAAMTYGSHLGWKGTRPAARTSGMMSAGRADERDSESDPRWTRTCSRSSR